MKNLSKRFFMGSIIASSVGGLLAIVALFLVATSGGHVDVEESLWALIPGGLLGVYGSIVWLVLLHRAWAAIQDGHARTTPSRAVGFLFIPVFNLYWAFQAFLGFAKDFNSYVERHSLRADPLPIGLFGAYCLLLVVGALPLPGFFMFLPWAVVACLQPLLANKICNAVNVAIDAKRSENP